MDSGLKQLQDQKKPACIHLKNGVKLTGLVLDFDQESIHLASSNEFGVIIDRSAVSSLQPRSPTERT